MPDFISAHPDRFQSEGQLHNELWEKYTNVLGGFEKRLSILSNVQARMQSKIKFLTGLRDGVSSHVPAFGLGATLRRY
jgi:hypothetical protein